MTSNVIKIKPQPGPQTEFLQSKADIVIYGGAAGGGKTYALLLESLWGHDIPGYSCVIFRKNANQVRNPGGLWDNSMELFNAFQGKSKESSLEWDFPSGAVIKFAHMDLEKDKLSWQGSQITLIGFDELTHFSWGQFVYMLSRNRSLCGIKPYIRATTNPDPDSWVRRFIDWWIDEKTGYPIQERSGIVRWFVVISDETIWADSKEQLVEKYPNCLPKSFTFIASNIYDNEILLSKDPGYLANLQALPRFEREQLLMGNWNIRPTAGMFFQRSFFEVLKHKPKHTQKVRYWDRAATKKTENNDPDFTVGLKLEKDKDGILYITDLVRLQESPLKVQNAIKNTASQDGKDVRIGVEQDPGQAGVSEADYLVRMLYGYPVKPYKATKDKVTRSLPVSAQAEAGNIKLIEAPWNEEFFRELENFPEGTHDDIVDALSGAFSMFDEEKYNLSSMITL
jgi:predicted phage terminase large subunit-like protein